MVPISSSMMAAQKAVCYSEALNEFKDPAKADIAAESYCLSMQCLHTMPIGFNIGDRQGRFTRNCKRYIKSNLSVQPSGFFMLPIAGWFFWMAIQSVIEWAICKMIDNYYEKYWVHKT